MTLDHSLRHTFVSWLKIPASWISIVSFLVSAITFYLVNLSAGMLDLQFPPEIAVQLTPAGQPLFLVPMIFHFTGAPTRQQVITRIEATVVMRPDDGSASQSLAYAWRRSYRFVGKLEFEHLYPELRQESAEDYVVYDSRSVPFTLHGGEASFKLLGLEPRLETAFPLAPGYLEVCLDVLTPDKRFRGCQAQYRLSPEAAEAARATGTYQWLSRPEIQR